MSSDYEELAIGIEAEVRNRLAVAGCRYPSERWQAVFRHALRETLDFVLTTGRKDLRPRVVCVVDVVGGRVRIRAHAEDARRTAPRPAKPARVVAIDEARDRRRLPKGA